MEADGCLVRRSRARAVKTAPKKAHWPLEMCRAERWPRIGAGDLESRFAAWVAAGQCLRLHLPIRIEYFRLVGSSAHPLIRTARLDDDGFSAGGYWI